MSRKRRLICGFAAGILLRYALYPLPLLQRIALIIWAVALIIFGALSDEKLRKIKWEHTREWWEKDVGEDQWN